VKENKWKHNIHKNWLEVGNMNI